MSKIPKVIHYCWFGKGEMNDRAKLCLKSWQEKLPDYEIKVWNEDNFDILWQCDFVRQAYEAGKYAYVADVARLYALYTEGGIYMDTDVEVYKPFDEEMLDCDAFIGFEDDTYLSTAVIGSIAGNNIMRYVYDYYCSIDFKLYDIWTDYIKYQETGPCIISNLLSLLGLNRNGTMQSLKNIKIYPNTYFHTKDEGYTYHSFNGSW